MKVHLTQWGDDLALRIPGPCARQAHLKPGDALEMDVTPRGELWLHPVPAAEPFDKAAFLRTVRQMRQSLHPSEPVVEGMRQTDRY